MAPVSVKSKKSATTAANSHKFIVDFSGPANDKIFDAAAYEKFLVDSIKVEGKTGQLGDDVKIAKEKEGQLSITSQIPFSKRYLKYLTKKATFNCPSLPLPRRALFTLQFLKKNLMREWLRVVATDKNTYTLKFYNVAFDGADEEDAE